MAKKSVLQGFFLFLMFTFLTGCNDDASPVSAVVSNGVVGTWTNELGLEYTFNANGTITGSAVDFINLILASPDETLAWTYNATQILINGQQFYLYTVNNDKLSLKDDSDEETVLTKKK